VLEKRCNLALRVWGWSWGLIETLSRNIENEETIARKQAEAQKKKKKKKKGEGGVKEEEGVIVNEEL
jgi:hypothetical protein